MPLITRSVSPVNLCLHRLPDSVQQDELQCVTNGTLANLIRQLSSLSRHAEQIFSEIHRETLKVDHRASTLFLRVERLSQKLSQSQDTANVKGVVDQVSLEEASMRKAFKSCNIIDQHSLDRQTLPQSLLEEYQSCDAPPQLNQLNPYREDEKEALRYYTDPDYFFELWRNEMLKECDGGLTEKKRAGRSSTSPSRQRRHQQQQFQQIPQNKQLFAQHMSSRSSDYSRFTPQIGHHSNSKSQQHRMRHGFGPNNFTAASVAADVLHFPAEYQTPQNLLFGSRTTHQHPPPGMSMIVSSGENLSQQRQTKPIEQPITTSNWPTKQFDASNHKKRIDEKNEAKSVHTADMSRSAAATDALVSGLGVMFLDDDDDELPPPPPHNILSSAMATTNSPPRIATSVSSSSPIGSANSSSTPALTNEASKHSVEANKCEFFRSNGSAEMAEFVTRQKLNEPQQQQQQSAAEQQPGQITHSIQQIPPSVPNLSVPSAPPPPPPPPPSNFSMKLATEGTKTFGGENEEYQQRDLQRKASSTGAQDSRSLLLVQIQEGVKLRKVRQQEELAEKRAVATSNDVAAILRKRMEHCLGDSDSSSEGSPSPEDNEWDD